MPIQDTGLDVYESAMRPVRQNVQAIFAHQAKQKADAESERRQLELEQRAERRQMELESRAEGRVISTEARRKAEEDSDTMAAAVAEAERYGLPTEGRTPEQLQQDVKKEVAKKVPRDFLLANMDKLPGILDQETISAIQNNALSEGELAQIKANVVGPIQVSRASDAEMFRKQSPVYLETLTNQQKRLTRIATQISEIKGRPLGQLATRAIERAFPKDGSQGADDWLKFQQKAAMRTIQDPDIQDVLDNPKYPLLRRNFANNPGAFSLNAVPIDADGNAADAMTDGDRGLLMEAYARAQDKIIEITGSDEERQYWRRESLLKAAHEARIPEANQMEFLRQQQHSIWKNYPELADWNSQQQKLMPKVNAATTGANAATTDSSSDGASSGFGNAIQRLQGTSNNSTPAAEATAPATELVAAEEPVAAEGPITEEELAAVTVPPAASIAVEDLGQDMGSPFGGTSANPTSIPETAAGLAAAQASAASMVNPLLSPYAKSSNKLDDLLNQKAYVDAEIQKMKDLESGKTEVPSLFGIPLYSNQVPVVNMNKAIRESNRLQLLIDAERHEAVPDLSERGPVPALNVMPSLRTPETGANAGSNIGQYEKAVQAQMGQAPPSLGNVTDPYAGYREMLLAPKPPTPFKQYLDDVLDPNRQGPFDRYLDTKAFNQANPPIGNEPWMQEYRNSQLPPAPQRPLPTQPTWQTY